MSQKYERLFLELDKVLGDFLKEVNGKKLDYMVTAEWTVKDVLGHISFWHQYYAQQYEALARGLEPYVLASLAGKNAEGQKLMKSKSKQTLVTDLLLAQESLRKSIVESKVPKMRYMKSREYTTGDFLEVIIGHFKRHTLQVKRAKNKHIRNE